MIPLTIKCAKVKQTGRLGTDPLLSITRLASTKVVDDANHKPASDIVNRIVAAREARREAAAREQRANKNDSNNREPKTKPSVAAFEDVVGCGEDISGSDTR